tara:strand:+ start:483 stop:944 length:462 start_codon:yes stop_codon:yes gene_type:complete
MFFSIILLSISGMQSYFDFSVYKANYQEFALLSTIFYMFSQTLIMFYFIASGTAIKKEIMKTQINTMAYEKVKKTKMILFPHLTFNILLLGTAFVLIGAVDTGAMSSLIQKLLFFVGFFHFLFTVRIQHIGFKENIDIIIELSEFDNTVKIVK